MSSDKIIGSVTWFDSKKGYGFVKVLTPDTDNTGNDIFLHFSNISVNDNEFKVVYPGEYVEFDITSSDDGRPCCLNLTGLYGGDLLTQNPNHRYKIYRKRQRESEPETDTTVEDAEGAESAESAEDAN